MKWYIPNFLLYISLLYFQSPFTHESLLIDRKDQRLTKSEKRLAKQGYEMEKKMNVSYSRPSYAAFYSKTGSSTGGLATDTPRIPANRYRSKI